MELRKNSESKLKIAKQIFNILPDTFYDKYGVISPDKDKYPYIPTFISIMSEITKKSWKSSGKFQPILNVFGMTIRNKEFLLEEEQEGAVRNVYDLISIYYEHSSSFFYKTIKNIRNNFKKDGNKILAYAGFISEDGEEITFPVLFSYVNVFLNVTIDPVKVKNIFRKYYEYAYEHREKFPPSFSFSSLVSKDDMNYFFREIDTYSQKLISIAKEKLNGFVFSPEGQQKQLFVNRMFADLILSANVEVLNGKDYLFFSLPFLKRENFEKVSYSQFISNDIVSYMFNKYKITDEECMLIKKIQDKIKTDEEIFKDKFIVLLSNSDFKNIKKMLDKDYELPDMESIKNYKDFSTMKIKNKGFLSFSDFSR